MRLGNYINSVNGKTMKKKGEVANIIKELVLESYLVKGHGSLYGLLVHKWATH